MKKSNSFVAPAEDLYLTTELEPGQLPAFLEKAISVADAPTQQDMLLLGTLTTASFAMPHVRILHGKPQHSYYPNLMSLVVAPPAAGKGVLNYMHRLVAPIQDKLNLQGKTAVIPANSSSAAFLDLLAMNQGAGLMIETEMDVLSQIWKNDFGNYSHLFRQAFEHETIRRARKAGAQALNYTEIPSPCLSAILSGTPNQLKPLLVNRENGLASRFLPYMVEDIIPFDRRALKNGDHIEENSALNVFQELGQELRQHWEMLAALDHDILWSLTDEQAEMLGDLFDDGYKLAMEEFHLPESFDATMKRMAVIIKRIGAILTVLRLPLSSSVCGMNPGETVPPTLVGRGGEQSEGFDGLHPANPILYCSDTDFHTLVLLAEKLTRHAALMTLMLPEEEKLLDTQVTSSLAERHADKLLDSLSDEFTTADAIQAGKALEMEQSTVRDHLALCCENKTIVRTKRGHYKKL